MQKMLEKVVEIVLKSGEIIKEGARNPKKITHKGRIDLVTETDLAVENFLKVKLSELLPESHFLAEETSANRALCDNTWVIDPLDGTTNFAHGFPFVATSVALFRNGEVVLGVVNLPMLGEIFTAFKGGGAFLNSCPISVSNCAELDQSLIATGFPYAIEEHVDFITTTLRKVLLSTQGVRRPGAAAIDLAYLACGRYDGFYESALKPWDMAAGWLLVKEAGGIVTEYNGDKFSLFSKSILAANATMHNKLIKLISN